MSDTTTDTMADLSRQARELANALFRGPECNQRNLRQGETLSCIQREEVRPLSAQEKKFGWTRRPFYAYSADAMCGPCRCYFYAEMAAQELHVLHCLGRKSEARRALPQKG